MFKKILAAVILSLLAIVGSMGAASANPISPKTCYGSNGQRVACVKYTYTGTHTRRVARTWHPHIITVHSGMTLWRVAVRCYGYKYSYSEKAGHLWKTVAKRNHIRGTTIYVGQRLYC